MAATKSETSRDK